MPMVAAALGHLDAKHRHTAGFDLVDLQLRQRRQLTRGSSERRRSVPVRAAVQRARHSAGRGLGAGVGCVRRVWVCVSVQQSSNALLFFSCVFLLLEALPTVLSLLPRL